MSGFNSYLTNKLVDHAFGSGTFSKPTLYLALFVGGTEVSGNGYARQQISPMTIAGNVASLTSNVDFPVATPSGWGTITGAAVYDAASGGNFLLSGTLAASKTIDAGDVFRAEAGNITFTIT